MSVTVPTILWAGLTPVIIVLAAAVIGVLAEAFVPRRARLAVHVILGLAAIAGSAVTLAGRWPSVKGGQGQVLTTGFNEDGFGVIAQGIMLVIGLLSLLVMAERTSARDGAFAAQAADRPGSAEEAESLHAGWMGTEVFPLMLFSLGGMMLFPLASNFITLFVLLELISLPLYVMAATARHRRLLSQEAALKYFVLGAFASAFLLLGAAFLYGLTGTVSYAAVHDALGMTGPVNADWLALGGVALVTIGLLFKIAAVPFHAWSPDVYQGAPTPVTGFMAAGVKAAAFLALVRFYYVAGMPLAWDMAPFLWTVAILTMLVGTVVGIVQCDIKRMLAYSAIAHAGYMLIGIVALNQESIRSLMFYVLAYGVATVGAFGVITLVRVSHDGAAGAEATDLDALAGLGRRSPWLAASLTLFLLSFAGIPLTAGFIGKFQLFVGGIAGGATWLVIAAIVSSAATAFFYMRVIILMFFHEPDGDRVMVVRSDGLAGFAIAVAVVATLVLGVIPHTVLATMADAAKLLP